MDHIVINVEDVEGMVAFYQDALDLPAERLEAYRAGDAPFPSVRLNDQTIIDFFPKPMWTDDPHAQGSGENMNHVCLAAGKSDWDALRQRLDARGIEIETGPAPRGGARGTGTSIYFRDPEGNLIEVRHYE
jgi:catechol 2,3-dioxygenase-like lactoylglutathione lyase family enzyme